MIRLLAVEYLGSVEAMVWSVYLSGQAWYSLAPTYQLKPGRQSDNLQAAKSYVILDDMCGLRLASKIYEGQPTLMPGLFMPAQVSAD